VTRNPELERRSAASKKGARTRIRMRQARAAVDLLRETPAIPPAEEVTMTTREDRVTEAAKRLAFAETVPALAGDELAQRRLTRELDRDDLVGRGELPGAPAAEPVLLGRRSPDGAPASAETSQEEERPRVGQVVLEAAQVILENSVAAVTDAEHTLASLQARKVRQFQWNVAPRGTLEYRNLMAAVLAKFIEILRASKLLKEINGEIRKELMIRPPVADNKDQAA
jgi:hypothetical protein